MKVTLNNSSLVFRNSTKTIHCNISGSFTSDGVSGISHVVVHGGLTIPAESHVEIRVWSEDGCGCKLTGRISNLWDLPTTGSDQIKPNEDGKTNISYDTAYVISMPIESNKGVTKIDLNATWFTKAGTMKYNILAYSYDN